MTGTNMPVKIFKTISGSFLNFTLSIVKSKTCQTYVYIYVYTEIDTFLFLHQYPSCMMIIQPSTICPHRFHLIDCFILQTVATVAKNVKKSLKERRHVVFTQCQQTHLGGQGSPTQSLAIRKTCFQHLSTKTTIEISMSA